MTDLIERLHGYNPPDRTVDEHRQMAQDIREAADELERLSEYERIINEGAHNLADRLEIERLSAQVESLQNKWATRPLSHPDGEALIAEIERLRNKLNTDSQNFEIECHKATIETLRRELAEALEANREVNTQCMKEAARVDDLERELAEALEWIATRGHFNTCNGWNLPPAKCDCGLDKLLKVEPSK